MLYPKKNFAKAHLVTRIRVRTFHFVFYFVSCAHFQI